MAYDLEPNPELLTPEYWGGVDIRNPNHFMGLPEIDGYIPKRVFRRAAHTLNDALTAVVKGKYQERPIRIDGEFDPSTVDFADGTVIIMDSEHLFRNVMPGREKRAEQVPTVIHRDKRRPITYPLAEYWKNNQGPELPKVHFGDEQAEFRKGDVQLSYGRLLQWGVLMSRKDGSRFMARWAFCAPFARYSDLVPGAFDVYTPWLGSEAFRTATDMPLDVARPKVIPEVSIVNLSIRGITRIRELTMVEPEVDEQGLRELFPTVTRAYQKVAEAAGRIALPRHIPSPMPA